jgi:HD-GYP domain-containing protein (c-di-GMP phosphodiesterase class II)
MRNMADQPEDENGLTAEQPRLIAVHPEIGASVHLPEREPRDQGTVPDALPRSAVVFAVGTFLIGVMVFAVYAPRLSHDGLVGLALLMLIAAIAERLQIMVYGNSTVSVSFIFLFAIGVLYGPAGVAVASPFVTLALFLPRNVLSCRFLFNTGSGILAEVSAAAVLWALIDHKNIEVSPQVVAASLVAAGVGYGVSSFLVTNVASLATRQSPRAVWQESFQWLFPHYMVFGLLGLACALAYRALGVTGLLAFVAPPFMMRLAMKQYVDKTARHVATLKAKNEQLERANREILAMSMRLKETYDATLEALAAALDARDRDTGGHSSRVSVYTMDMARCLGIREGSAEWLDIERASLLHDVGKIGVPDSILNKPGPLTAEEWQEMRKHPAIGYEMLRDVMFLSAAAEIVYSHHERYDGKGYPKGLKGDEIPVGSRIFAVADAFDAMTSDRPYRRALDWRKAREEIINNNGVQFDPEVVKAFLRCVDRWSEGLEERRAA